MMTNHWGTEPKGVPQPWFARGQRRLDQILKSAPELPFDDSSKIILLSDAHRGDRGAHDEFAPNEDLFVHALSHYATAGFTYIELGDGDDLWQTPRFSDIERAYPRVFALLHRFQQQQRLHLSLTTIPVALLHFKPPSPVRAWTVTTSGCGKPKDKTGCRGVTTSSSA